MTLSASSSATAAQGALLRLAEERDAPTLETLIALSVRSLQAATYTPAQIAAALGTLFGVDHQLIADRTYWLAERGGAIVGCGGWSHRATLFGAHPQGAADAGSLLDPTRDAARIRAFFVHPDHARQGIGRLLLAASERAAVAAGFRRFELVATLAGEPLYLAFAFRAVARYEVPLPKGLSLPVVRMVKTLSDPSANPQGNVSAPA